MASGIDQTIALVAALVVGGVVAVGIVYLFAILLQPFKELMPVSFIVAAVLGAFCGLRLRRTMLANDSHKSENES